MFLPPAQYLRKSFTVDKPVRRATVYSSALGNYKLNIGGRPVGQDYFTPGWTDYNIRVYYNTYDVTGMIGQGENALGAILADGWYSGFIGWGRIRDHYGKNTRFAAQLRIEYADGSVATIVTDESWKARTGRILEADFLMGETCDARKPMPFARRANAAISDEGWSGVDVTDTIAAKLEAYPGVPVRKFQEIKPLKITEPVKGTYIYDMGTNFAGFARLKIRGKAGQKITLRYAERLNPDGTIYTTNLRGARATDTYICRGANNDETWQPQFTFHGFQYVELTGVEEAPTLDAITGIELTSSTPVVGAFESSDAMANQLYHNICQTQRANFIDLPTDCPQRDERLGWTGDAQIYVRTATNNTDVSAFYTKWLVDLEDAQGPKGDFPDVAPRKVATGGGTAAWGDAGVICPWTIYQVYGDKRVLEEHYDGDGPLGGILQGHDERSASAGRGIRRLAEHQGRHAQGCSGDGVLRVQHDADGQDRRGDRQAGRRGEVSRAVRADSRGVQQGVCGRRRPDQGRHADGVCAGAGVRSAAGSQTGGGGELSWSRTFRRKIGIYRRDLSGPRT